MAKSLREVLQASKANSPGQDHRHQTSQPSRQRHSQGLHPLVSIDNRRPV